MIDATAAFRQLVIDAARGPDGSVGDATIRGNKRRRRRRAEVGREGPSPKFLSRRSLVLRVPEGQLHRCAPASRKVLRGYKLWANVCVVVGGYIAIVCSAVSAKLLSFRAGGTEVRD